MREMENITVRSIEELRYLVMEELYRFSPKDIQEGFNLSKTQYYDYIHSYVSKVKVPKRVRNEISGIDDYKNDREYNLMSRIDLMNESVLLNIYEVYLSLLSRGEITFSLYNKSTGYYMGLSDDEVDESGVLLLRALVNSKTRREFPDFDDSKEPTANYKTRQSRFYAMLKDNKHFKIVVCGVWCYALFENIKPKEDEFLYDISSGSSELLKEKLKIFRTA